MYSSMETIGFSTYFNDVVNYFYEDEKLVAHLGKKLGFDVSRDMFLGVVFLYPSTEQGTFEEKEKGLQRIMEHMAPGAKIEFRPEMLTRTAVWKINVYEFTGKERKAK